MSKKHPSRSPVTGDLYPLLPAYRPGKYDYFHGCYLRGGCTGGHRYLSVAAALDRCKEDYAVTGDQMYLDQALEYLEELETAC